MRIDRPQPDGAHPTPGCRHVTLVETGGDAYLAGRLVELDLTAALAA